MLYLKAGSIAMAVIIATFWLLFMIIPGSFDTKDTGLHEDELQPMNNGDLFYDD